VLLMLMLVVELIGEYVVVEEDGRVSIYITVLTKITAVRWLSVVTTRSQKRLPHAEHAEELGSFLPLLLIARNPLRRIACARVCNHTLLACECRPAEREREHQ
jgi:hypothetical protein